MKDLSQLMPTATTAEIRSAYAFLWMRVPEKGSDVKQGNCWKLWHIFASKSPRGGVVVFCWWISGLVCFDHVVFVLCLYFGASGSGTGTLHHEYPFSAAVQTPMEINLQNWPIHQHPMIQWRYTLEGWISRWIFEMFANDTYNKSACPWTHALKIESFRWMQMHMTIYNMRTGEYFPKQGLL